MRNEKIDSVSNYTSTGMKLLHHPALLNSIKTLKRAMPITLQIAPTSSCNLKCSFCSNSKREQHESLNINDLKELLPKLKKVGLKAVEITGGGDPTMYKRINTLVKLCIDLGIDVGMITNGILLREKLLPNNYKKLKWLRISANALEYVDKIDIPAGLTGTLGFSLCIHKDINLIETSMRLRDHIDKYKPKYVRVVPDCLPGDNEDAIRDRAKQYALVNAKIYNGIFFYQDKVFDTPYRCWWNYIKPFLLHDGWVYPCSSVVLNSGAEGCFHRKFRWVEMADLPSMYNKTMVPLPTHYCDRCVFTTQNKAIDLLINRTGMENFI